MTDRDTTEVFIRRDPESGDVILSRRPPDWEGFFSVRGTRMTTRYMLDTITVSRLIRGDGAVTGRVIAVPAVEDWAT